MEWLPIETAPRDGTHILTFAAGHGVAEGYWVSTSDGDTWRDDGAEPSHWMPLPPPPAGQT